MRILAANNREDVGDSAAPPAARWDETWHRLSEWTNGQGPSERLAHQILYSEGYAELDPSHPLGGPDGGKDAVCSKGGSTWIMAVYFPRGQQRFSAIKKKLLDDVRGLDASQANGLVFVTNQELSLAEREDLKATKSDVPVEIYHLERITSILDQPRMARVRRQFLLIDDATSAPSAKVTDEAPLGGSTVEWLEPTASLVGRDGAVIPPVSWSIRLRPGLPSPGTKAELHEAATGAVVAYNTGDAGGSARWPRLLVLPQAQQIARGDRSQLWTFAYETGARKEVGDEQLLLSPSGVVTFQRDTLWDVNEPAADIGLLADDVLSLLIFAGGFAKRLGADDRMLVEIFLRVPSSSRGTLALFQGTSVSPDQPHRAGRLPAPRTEVQGGIGASIASIGTAAGVVAAAKRLVDGVANEFALGTSAHGSGPPFMAVAAASLATRLADLRIAFQPDADLMPSTAGPALSLSFKIEDMERDGAGSVNVHHYVLTVSLSNKTNKMLRDWYIEVELPTPLLEPRVGQDMLVSKRSDAVRSVFRSSLTPPPIPSGDDHLWRIPYRVDDELYWHRRDVVERASATARAFVDGALVAETTLSKIQRF